VNDYQVQIRKEPAVVSKYNNINVELRESVIIREGRRSQQPPGRAPTCI